MNNKFRSRRPEARRRRTEVRNPMGRYVNWRRAVGISHLRLDSLALARLPGGSSQNSKVGATTGSEYHMICNVIFSEIRKNAGFRGNMKVFTKVAIIPLISVQKEARVGGRGSSQDLQCDFIGGRTIWTFQTDNSHEYTAVAAGDKSKVRSPMSKVGGGGAEGPDSKSESRRRGSLCSSWACSLFQRRLTASALDRSAARSWWLEGR
jgi:hypothetical protein